MKLQESRKSAITIELVVVIAIALLAMAVALPFILKSIGISTKDLWNQIRVTDDCDCDQVANVADKCPCPDEGYGTIANEGCPAGYKIKGIGTGVEKKDCLKDCPKTC